MNWTPLTPFLPLNQILLLPLNQSLPLDQTPVNLILPVDWSVQIVREDQSSYRHLVAAAPPED